jgi:filamentous hemagglutinin family protein
MIGLKRVIAPVLVSIVLQSAMVGDGEAQITVDGSLGPRKTLDGPNYAIGAELGQTRDRNLFHSFGDFNVRTGESATFNGPASIQNILGRVTGGNQSFIDGLLRSTISGANLYLINPNGVVMGPNASLDVSGAFHLATADYLRFSDAGVFHANLANATVLSVAPPTAFGFLSGNPASISIQGTVLQVPTGQTLSIVAGDVQITGAALRAPAGRIHIASVGSPGLVTPNPPEQAPGLAVEGFERLGQIDVTQSSISVRGDPGGTVLIRGGRLMMNGSTLSAATDGGLNHPGIGVDIDIKGQVTLRSSEIASSSFGAGRAGGLRIAAESLELAGDPASGFNSNIGSRGFASGAAGNLEITTNELLLQANAFINAPSLSAGAGGNIDVRTGSLTLIGERGPAFIATGAFGTGDSGDMAVHAESVLARGGVGGFTGLATQVSDQASGAANGGSLRLTTGTLTLLDGGQISSGLFRGSGRGGSIDITADRIMVSGRNPFGFQAGIFADAQGLSATGTGGDIRINANDVQLTDRGSISASAFFGSPGNAGNVTLTTGTLGIRNGSFVSSSALFGSGNAGAVDVHADRIEITGIRNSVDPFNTDFTGISTATRVGRGGELRVTGSDILITDKGSLSSVSIGSGPGGNIHVQLGSGSLRVMDGGTIAASAFGAGAGGTIDVAAGSVTVAGAGQFNGPTDAGVSGIASQSGIGGGRAGALTITAGSLRVLDGGKVSTETFGAGDGGSISVTADTVVVSGANAALRTTLSDIPGADSTAASAAITASSNRFFLGDAAIGRAGNIRIVASDIQVTAEGAISSKTTTPGSGGTIDLVADRVSLAGGALVTAQSQVSPNGGKAGDVSITARGTFQVDESAVTTAADQAQGGTITVSAHQVELANGAVVSARSDGPGDAGNVTITAGGLFRSRNGALTTEALLADGGDIRVIAGSMVHLVDSRITTSVRSGVGRGGNITIDPDFVLLKDSQIRADAFGGPGGNVQIVANVFLTSGSVVSASSALGVPGTIDIQASITDVSGNVSQLPQGALQASALLRASCATRLAGGKLSSLVVAGRDGIPPDPGGVLPSLIVGEIGTSPASSDALRWVALTAHGAGPILGSRALNRLCSR